MNKTMDKIINTDFSDEVKQCYMHQFLSMQQELAVLSIRQKLERKREKAREQQKRFQANRKAGVPFKQYG